MMGTLIYDISCTNKSRISVFQISNNFVFVVWDVFPYNTSAFDRWSCSRFREPSPFYGGAFHIAEEGREELYEAQV